MRHLDTADCVTRKSAIRYARAGPRRSVTKRLIWARTLETRRSLAEPSGRIAEPGRDPRRRALIHGARKRARARARPIESPAPIAHRGTRSINPAPREDFYSKPVERRTEDKEEERKGRSVEGAEGDSSGREDNPK